MSLTNARHNFRVKADFSRVFQDVRQQSWVFVDASKIVYVNNLIDHIHKLFDVNKPFYLLAKHEDALVFLPFDEDVRVLENNDTVVIVPDANNTCSILNEQESTLPKHTYSLSSVNFSSKLQVDSQLTDEKSCFSNKSMTFDKSLPSATTANPSETSLGGSFYKTALYDTIEEDKDEPTTNEDKSLTIEDANSVKRKRVRKRKQKKNATMDNNLPESDTSFSESTNKKPKIIDSILIASGKHIRFEGIDDVVEASNGMNANQKQEDFSNKDLATKELSALLNLKHSSTPLTFSHKKKVKKVFKPTETIDEIKPLESLVTLNMSTDSVKPIEESNGNDHSVKANKSFQDTVSFKIFRMGEDYTPQLSSIIIAQVLSNDDSQYKLKILHGQDQLQDPQGKFSLPADDEDPNASAEDVVLLERSKLIELTKVEAV